MPRKAEQITCSRRVRNLIEQELGRHHLESHYGLRMHIIHLGASGAGNQQIARLLGCHEKTVRKWRRRWKRNQQQLSAFEQGPDGKPVGDKELTEQIKQILSDAPRPGAPARLREAEIDRLMALACQAPASYGLPFTHWTQQELSNQARRMGIIVSQAHVCRLLKKTGCVPTGGSTGYIRG